MIILIHGMKRQIKNFLDFSTIDHTLIINDREKRLAKKYWDKLYKEYCIADLSRYKENKVSSRKI